MNIAIIESEASINAGGAEKSMAALSDFIIKSKLNVFLICEKKGLYSFEGLKCQDNLIINMQPFRTQGICGYLKAIYSMVVFIKRNKINLLITHTIHSFPLIRIVKFFTSCRTIIYFKWVYNGNDIGHFNRWGLNGMTVLVAINKYVANYWRSFIYTGLKFELIPDGVQIPHEAKESIILKRNRVLYVGRIYEGKGLHLLINSLRFVDPHVLLDVVGYYDFINDHPNLKYHQFIHQLVVDYELDSRITFHGQLADIELLYNSVDLVVVPSILPDAQPLVILEAMARKTLVIGADVGGIPEIFTEDLANLIFPANIWALAVKMQTMLAMNDTEISVIKGKLFDRFLESYEITQTHNKFNTLIMNYDKL